MRFPRTSAWVVVCALLLGGAPSRGLQPAPPAVAAAAPDPDGANAPTEFQALPEARTKVDEILKRKEFRHVEQNSYVDQLWARFWAFVGRLWSRATGMMPQSRWVAVAIEWGVLILAAVGLLIWLLRLGKQQRLAIAAGSGGAIEVWRRESDNWAERARTEAARGEWREAVHCLYWSAIVLLEGQRMWRQNRARTPREYVRLLEPGSEKQMALGGLTRVFERIWYGLRPAAESDDRQADAMLEQLRTR